VKRYLEFIGESLVNREIIINSENDFHLIKEGVKKIYAHQSNLTYLPELPESLTNLYCYDNELKSLPKLPESLEYLNCRNNKLETLPKLPESLKELYCRNNRLESLPKLSESLMFLSCRYNYLTFLPEFPESLRYMVCDNNPLEYPIPHKFYKDQDNIWLEEFNLKLSTYEHQKRLIDKHGVYIMKKYENHSELINDKIKEENPTYFLSVEYGF